MDTTIDFRAQALANCRLLFGPSVEIVTLSYGDYNGYGQALAVKIDIESGAWECLLHGSNVKTLLGETEIRLSEQFIASGVSVPLSHGGDQCGVMPRSGMNVACDVAGASTDTPAEEEAPTPEADDKVEENPYGYEPTAEPEECPPAPEDYPPEDVIEGWNLAESEPATELANEETPANNLNAAWDFWGVSKKDKKKKKKAASSGSLGEQPAEPDPLPAICECCPALEEPLEEAPVCYTPPAEAEECYPEMKDIIEEVPAEPDHLGEPIPEETPSSDRAEAPPKKIYKSKKSKKKNKKSEKNKIIEVCCPLDEPTPEPAPAPEVWCSSPKITIEATPSDHDVVLGRLNNEIAEVSDPINELSSLGDEVKAKKNKKKKAALLGSPEPIEELSPLGGGIKAKKDKKKAALLGSGQPALELVEGVAGFMPIGALEGLASSSARESIPVAVAVEEYPAKAAEELLIEEVVEPASESIEQPHVIQPSNGSIAEPVEDTNGWPRWVGGWAANPSYPYKKKSNKKGKIIQLKFEDEFAEEVVEVVPPEAPEELLNGISEVPGLVTTEETNTGGLDDLHTEKAEEPFPEATQHVKKHSFVLNITYVNRRGSTTLHKMVSLAENNRQAVVDATDSYVRHISTGDPLDDYIRPLRNIEVKSAVGRVGDVDISALEETEWAECMRYFAQYTVFPELTVVITDVN